MSPNSELANHFKFVVAGLAVLLLVFIELNLPRSEFQEMKVKHDELLQTLRNRTIRLEVLEQKYFDFDTHLDRRIHPLSNDTPVHLLLGSQQLADFFKYQLAIEGLISRAVGSNWSIEEAKQRAQDLQRWSEKSHEGCERFNRYRLKYEQRRSAVFLGSWLLARLGFPRVQACPLEKFAQGGER